MSSYYAERLSGRRLQQCYEVAPARVQQYLEAEIDHVLAGLHHDDVVLELGCGYGRVALRLAEQVRLVVGIDLAEESLVLARRLGHALPHCQFVEMDALALSLSNDTFDVVLCIQNGICAFGVSPMAILREALRVTKPGGRILLSTYTDDFWPHRLSWFEAQSSAGLMGDIDRAKTKDGVIVCVDGFRSGTLSPAEFRAMGLEFGVEAVLSEVDGSSLFFSMTKACAT